jgi:hypothetical protein
MNTSESSNPLRPPACGRTVRRSAACAAGALALAVSLVAGCHIVQEWHHADPAVVGNPMRHIGAVTRNHEFLLTGDYNAGAVKLWGTANPAAPLFQAPLAGEWTPVAASTYRGPAYNNAVGRNVASESFLVLHTNGKMIPFYHDAAKLFASPPAMWMNPAPFGAGVSSRMYVDVGQDLDGTIYVAANESTATGPKAVLLKRSPAGAWTSTYDTTNGQQLYKIASLAVDSGSTEVVVADDPGPANTKRITRYGANLVPAGSFILPATKSVQALQSMHGYTMMGLWKCGAGGCGQSENLISIVSPNGAETEHRVVQGVIQALGLDLPPMPLNLQGYTTTYLWHVGWDQNKGIHKYRIDHQ